MGGPNHWQPSRLAIPSMGTLDPVDSRITALKEFNISRHSTGGIDGANRLYGTDAEDPNQVAPHLARNMQKDYQNRGLQERSYLVLPGGDTLYHTPTDTAHRQSVDPPPRFLPVFDRPTEDRYAVQSRVRNHQKVPFPERAAQLGHNPKGQADNIRGRGGWP